MDNTEELSNLNVDEHESFAEDKNESKIDSLNMNSNEGILNGDMPDPKESIDESKIETHEERLRRIKEANEIERQKRLEEMIEAQKRAEEKRQKEMLERKKKIDNLNKREHERKKLAEQKRKLLEEKEKEKTENILKRNKERENRIAQQKMTQSTTQSSRALNSSRMTTSLYSSNGIADSTQKFSNNNFNFHNSSRSSWLLSSYDAISSNNNAHYKHTSRASSNRKNASVTKNRTRSHDPMSKNSNCCKTTPNTARRNVIPDGFIEVDSGVVIPANTRHAGCFVPYKGPSYRVRGVLAWRPPPPLPNYSSSLSSSNQSSPRINNDDVTKNQKNNSAAWWHEIKSRKNNNKVRPRTSQSTPRSMTTINKNRKVSISSGDGDGDNGKNTITDNTRNPYQRTRQFNKPPSARRTYTTPAMKPSSAMSTSMMVTKDEKENSISSNSRRESSDNMQSLIDRLSKPRRSGSQPPKANENQQDENTTGSIPKYKQSPLPTRKFKSMGPSLTKVTPMKPNNNSTSVAPSSTPKITRKTPSITPLSTTKTNVKPKKSPPSSVLEAAAVAAQKSIQQDHYSTTPRDSGLSSTPNSELVEQSEQEQPVQQVNEQNSLDSTNLSQSRTLETPKNVNDASSNPIVGSGSSSKSKKEVIVGSKNRRRLTQLMYTNRKSNVKEADTSMPTLTIQEEPGLTEEEAYKIKLQEQKKLAREKKEKLLEEERRKDEENRLKLLEERKRHEEEARIMREKQRELEAEEEARRLVELERQRLEEEEEARRKEEEKKLAEEKRQEEIRKKEDERMDRKRRLEQIMSRVKAPSNQANQVPTLMTTSTNSIKEDNEETKTVDINTSVATNESVMEASGDNSDKLQNNDAEVEIDTSKKTLETDECLENGDVKQVWREEDQVTEDKKESHEVNMDESPDTDIEKDPIPGSDTIVTVEHEPKITDTENQPPIAASTPVSNKTNSSVISTPTPQFKSRLLQDLLGSGRLGASGTSQQSKLLQQQQGTPSSNDSSNSAYSLLNAHKRHSMIVTGTCNSNGDVSGYHHKSIDDTNATSDEIDQHSFNNNTSLDGMSHSKSMNCNLSNLSAENSDSNVEQPKEEKIVTHSNNDTSNISNTDSTYYLEEINNNQEISASDKPDANNSSSENNNIHKYQSNQLLESTEIDLIPDLTNADYNMNMEQNPAANFNELSP